MIGTALFTAACATTAPTRGPSLAGRPLEPAQGCAALAEQAPNSTFVLYLPRSGRLLGCNAGRAAISYLPASTYKAPHALIALETGEVQDATAAFAWDGRTRRVAAWNRPTSLGDGLRNSTVWVYQAVARRVGWSLEKTWVARLNYGNEAIGPESDLTSFWLDGELRISAIEQTEFLDRLRRGALPASQAHQATVRRMMMASQPETAAEEALYAKSGAVLPIDPETGDISDAPEIAARLQGEERVGWYVGWIDAPGEAADAVFAFNLRLEAPGDLARREALTRRLLEANRDARTAP